MRNDGRISLSLVVNRARRSKPITFAWVVGCTAMIVLMLILELLILNAVR